MSFSEDAATHEFRDMKPLLTIAGANSRIEETTYTRATSADEFQRLFLRHIGEDPTEFDAFYNPHCVPLIDFERCMVVAVFRGQQWNTAGVYIDIVIDDGQRLIVRFMDRTYQTFGPDGGGERVTPFGIFVLPRSDRALVLEQGDRQYKNEPYKWEQKASFPALTRP